VWAQDEASRTNRHGGGYAVLLGTGRVVVLLLHEGKLQPGWKNII
jgi:hypothetical protein